MRTILTVTLAVLVLTLGLVGCDKGHDWNTVADDHPNLEAAREQARNTYPEFVAAMKTRRPMDVFTVEVNYNHTEYVTLQVIKATENEVVGVVDNFPQKVGLKKGEQVTVSLDDMTVLSDWTIDKEDGSQVGGVVAAEKVRLSGRGD